VARSADRHPSNIAGDWYVDTRCIDCDVSRHYAPGLIEALPDGQSVVARQPASPEEELLMWRAALACPTRSIGTVERRPEPAGVFPWEVTPGVFLCGHNDRRSFGAHAWFVPRAGGGLLVDSPHRDDVADASRFAEHFGARVWVHEADRDAAPFASDIIGDDETEIDAGVIAFPVPGHTRGSVLYLHDERHLFSGDSLAWFHREEDLGAFRGATWYSWPEQRASLRRFVDSGHRFEWICPGHGKWHGAPAGEMHDRLAALVARM
jgi:ferredoxin